MREGLQYFRRLVRLLRPYWMVLGKTMVLGMVAAALGLLVPLIAKLLFDHVFPSRDWGLLQVAVVAGLGLAIGAALVGALRNYFSTVVAARINNATLLMFFNHVQHISPRFFEQKRVGEVMSRFQDVRGSLSAITRVLDAVLATGIYLVVVPPLLLWLNWRLASVAMLSVPFSLALSLGSARILRRAWKASAEAAGELGAMQIECFSQIRTVKALSLEFHTFRRVRTQTEEAMRLQLRASMLSHTFGVFGTSVAAAGMALFTWYGWRLILLDQMTLGQFMAFSTYVGYVLQPVSQWVSLVSSAQQTAVQLGRMFEYLDIRSEQEPGTAYRTPRPVTRLVRGEIVCTDVSFSYDSYSPVLSGVSLTFPTGSVTAVVGSSGTGKSTLLRLLCATEVPTGGIITIDGTPLSGFTLQDVRRQMGVVWQDAGLFQGSIWDNLTVGLDRPHRNLVDEAVSICQLEETISQLSAGYDTPVGEWGTTLSAGQKQRIALARVLIRQTPVVLLDEATANIDVGTEAEILRRLLTHLRGRTLIMVTHRVTTATALGRICVLDRGRVAGLGRHADLLAGCDAYRRINGAATPGSYVPDAVSKSAS